MDSDGLPIVGPGIDFTKVGAIHQKRTVAFLNHFITHTARFLNHFSCVCEEKLEHLATRLQRLETTMNILEAKLSSIPGLDAVTLASSSQSADQPSQPSASQPSTQPPDTPIQAHTDTTQDAPTNQVPPPVAETEKTHTAISEDPRYAKYFKMLHVGVNPMAVKTKMAMEGLNPDLLDNPAAPAPPRAENVQQDADSDFSDDGGPDLSDAGSSSGFSDN